LNDPNDREEEGEEMIAPATPQELSELGRRLSAARRIVESTCEVCGKPIKGIRKRKYCSHAHAEAASYQRRRGRDDGGKGLEPE
jgi:RNA polymerase-binding transcription factor DksA